MMEENIASWSVNLYVDCPHCEHYFDIFDDWSEQEMYDEVQPGESKKLSGDFEVTCPKCVKEFKITETQH